MRPFVRLPGVADPEGGVALVMVLLVLALLLAVVGEFALQMRLEGTTTQNFRAAVIAVHLAEAAYQRAVAEILPDAVAHHLDERGLLVFRRTARESPKAPTRLDVALGSGRFSYRITDEQSRINLNGASPATLHRLLSELGVERAPRDEIVDSILDWKDPNETHRLNGAESEYYLALPVPYRAKNANFYSVEELLQVRGMTRAILDGRPESPGLAAYLTVAGPSQINVNTASATVLRAHGFAEAEVGLIMAGRPHLDAARLSTQFRRGNLRTGSTNFRIEAWGEVPGQGRRTLTAIVQRGTGRDGVLRVTPVSWRWEPEEPVPPKPEVAGARERP